MYDFLYIGILYGIDYHQCKKVMLLHFRRGQGDIVSVSMNFT